MLNIRRKQIEACRKLAASITEPVQDLIDASTTTAIERTTLRLLGVEGHHMGADQHPMPLVNLFVDRVRRQADLSLGALRAAAAVMDQRRVGLQEAVEGVATGKFALVDRDPSAAARALLQKKARAAVQQLKTKARTKNKKQGRVFGRSQPLRYVIVATGNIHEDVLQAQAAARNGADIIAVIRSTAQSLLDFVPVGLTTVGFGGTFATQENFRLMRQALWETSKELGRYIHLTNYSSGLCMPEIAAIAALEDLDMLLNDAMYGILFRDINMQRTFIDQYFSRLICAKSGIYIQTGEDNYLTTADAYGAAHHVLASQFINERFALRAGLPEGLMCLGHAFEMNPNIEDGFLWEVAQAQMIRQVFPKAPLKYMPPTKHKTGDFFWSNLYDGMFNFAGQLTGQTIMLLGMATEALHNPKMHDRYWSLKNANYIFNNTHHLKDEIIWKPRGRMEKRANQVIDNTHRMLRRVQKSGLMPAIAKGWFADVKRHPQGGKGLEGVLKKSPDYWNPLWKELER